MQNKKKTSAVYGNLFTAYSREQFEHSVSLFLKRHTEWKYDVGFDVADFFKGKRCLDAGCGGGRFVVALSQLGARDVVGIDISEKAIEAATQRIAERDLVTVARVQVASVLEIPFPENSFDYVVSSGVIHHTPNPKGAFEELCRVLSKDKGTLFLSVYGSGGLKWMLNDLFRYTICKVIPFSVMEKIWKFVGVPANKRYNMLDNLYVPFCYRFTEKEIRQWLVQAGFSRIVRVKFERYDFCRPLSRLIHGEGWLQFYAFHE